MLSAISDFFGGSSDKTKNIEEHILPIPQHTGRQLTYTDCFTWLNQKVVILLRKFDNPQVGTVKYIGSDDRGKLCAGIEFEYNVGGMGGKFHGQKLFKCRPGHGLLIPVEFVRLLVDHEDGRNIFPVTPPRSNSSSPSTSNGNRTHSQSAPNVGVPNNPSIPIEDFTPLTLPELKLGDNVVWLGGTTPQTGIVRWIGRAGRSNDIPIKVWMEMDDYMGYGHTELDVGTKFGCASGRGKLLPADQLILLENFLPEEITEAPFVTLPNAESNLLPFCDVPPITNDQIDHTKPTALVVQEPESTSAIKRSPINCDLIDFSEGDDLKVTPEGNTLVDLDFLRVMRPDEPMDTEDGSDGSGKNSAMNSLEIDSSVAATNEFVFVASAPALSIADGSLIGVEPYVTEPVNDSRTPEQGEIDVNGNMPTTKTVFQNGFLIPEKVAEKLVDDTVADYLPPFIIPPIDIVEFFRAEGSKGIQGKRNSCYIDVVLFSMFAFTDTFDPYFLVKSNLFNKVPDSALTKTAKKVLAEQVVNPLRQSYYCSAGGVNELRELMIPFSDGERMDGAFLDIEEFMLIMFDKLFQLKEFITYDNGLKDYLHQVNLGDHTLPPVMTLKQCLEMSFKDYNLKLQNIPSPAFIIEIPRHHSGIIQSTTIVPNLTLNMDTLVDNRTGGGGNFGNSSTMMNLVAVICINDFHFVTFVKCGKGVLSHWVLFDSNPSEERPKVEMITNMGECLESMEHQVLTNPVKLADNKHKLPPFVQRLLSDIYVCIYCPVNMI